MRSSKVIRIGNSLGAIFPKYILSYLNWNLGDRIYFSFDKNGLTIKKVPKIKAGNF